MKTPPGFESPTSNAREVERSSSGSGSGGDSGNPCPPAGYQPAGLDLMSSGGGPLSPDLEGGGYPAGDSGGTIGNLRIMETDVDTPNLDSISQEMMEHRGPTAVK